MRPARLAAALVLAAGLAPAAASAQEPDPFYLDLERAGQLALARGDAAGAARRLRVACFGMLDAPARLAACLVRLALAGARSGDREGFLATFERLDAIEARFGAYREAPLEAAERGEFEARLGDWAEPAMVEGRPAFAAVAALRALAGAAELAAERPQEALARLDAVASAERSERWWCLRGEALAGLDRCTEAAAAFTTCRPELEARSAAAAMRCLVALGRAGEARRIAETAPPAVRTDREVKRQLRRLPAPRGVSAP